MANATAAAYITELERMAGPGRHVDTRQYFKEEAPDDYWIGVRMGDALNLSKEYVDMPFEEVERLLESKAHEARVGAVKILARKAARKGGPADDLARCYALYLRRHDRINNWDLVDLGAWDVIGRHLLDRDRAPLYRLAESNDKWERRTAQLAPLWFLRRRSEVADALALAEILMDDPEDLVNKATGGVLREVGKVAPELLVSTVEAHAGIMPQATISYALEKLPQPERKRLKDLRKARRAALSQTEAPR